MPEDTNHVKSACINQHLKYCIALAFTGVDDEFLDSIITGLNFAVPRAGGHRVALVAFRQKTMTLELGIHGRR